MGLYVSRAFLLLIFPVFSFELIPRVVAVESDKVTLNLVQLSTLSRAFSATPPPLIESWLTVHRKDYLNLHSREAVEYLDAYSEFGMLRGLCDTREILNGSIIVDIEEFASDPRASLRDDIDSIRYCDVFAYLYEVRSGNEPPFKRKMDRSDRNAVIVKIIKTILDEEISGTEGSKMGSDAQDNNRSEGNGRGQ